MSATDYDYTCPDCGSDDTMEVIKETLEDVARTGTAQCRLCDHTVEGNDFGEILERLAEHGEHAHEWTEDGWKSP